MPGGGGTERLPRAIGRDRALEAILSSADYDAGTAERWGWVTRALPDAELDAFVNATAARLASFDRQALATAKAMVNRATPPTWLNCWRGAACRSAKRMRWWATWGSGARYTTAICRR